MSEEAHYRNPLTQQRGAKHNHNRGHMAHMVLTGQPKTSTSRFSTPGLAQEVERQSLGEKAEKGGMKCKHLDWLQPSQQGEPGQSQTRHKARCFKQQPLDKPPGTQAHSKGETDKYHWQDRISQGLSNGRGANS
jgi:hypothetical protein